MALAEFAVLFLDSESVFPQGLEQEGPPQGERVDRSLAGSGVYFLFIKLTQSLALCSIVFDVQGQCGNFCFT